MYGGVVFDNFEGVLLVLDYFIFFLGHLISEWRYGCEYSGPLLAWVVNPPPQIDWLLQTKLFILSLEFSFLCLLLLSTFCPAHTPQQEGINKVLTTSSPANKKAT